MHEVIPQGMFSWRFDICDGRRRLATVDFGWLRERGGFDVEGVDFDVYRDGLLSGAYVLESQGQVVAKAEKQSMFTRRFEIEHDGRSFELAAASAFRREFVLTENGRRRGSMRPKSWFGRAARSSFAEDIPLGVRVFLIWLTLLLWRRQQNAASS